MRKALPVLLAFVSIFIVGCSENGSPTSSSKVPSKLKVLIERQNTFFSNEKLTVYAMDFRKEGRTLTFVCPCYIPGSKSDGWLNVRVEGDSFKLTALPDAQYNVKVQYWVPNYDGNTEVQFQISR